MSQQSVAVMALIEREKEIKTLKTIVSNVFESDPECLNPSGPTYLTANKLSKKPFFQTNEKSVAASAAPYPYKLARLVHHNYSLRKRWFVIYYAWHLQKEQLVRVRQYDPINRKKTVKERMEVARELIDLVNSQLMEGRCLGKDKIIDATARSLRTLTIIEGLQYFIEQKKLERLRKGGLKRFHTFIELFKLYFDHVQAEPYTLKEFDKEVINNFFHWLQTERKISNKTFNNYRGDLNTFFRWVMKKDARVLKQNPMGDISKLKTVARKHAAYSDEQMKKIKAQCIEMNLPQLLLFIQFVYYTLARPKELRDLKIAQIDLKENRIFIPGSISKNSRDEYVPLAPDLRKAIVDAKLMDLPGDYFIFGYGGLPGLQPCGIDYFYAKNAEVLKALNMKDKNHTIYSYKHSGAVDLYRACKDIKLVQRICRHQTIEQTNTYLRDLGLLTDYDSLNFWKGNI